MNNNEVWCAIVVLRVPKDHLIFLLIYLTWVFKDSILFSFDLFFFDGKKKEKKKHRLFILFYFSGHNTYYLDIVQ